MDPSIAAAVLVASIRWGSLGPLVLASLAIMGSPGPATIGLAAAGLAYGVRRSLAYLVGVAAGTMLVLVAVAAGITATLLAVPGLRTVLTGIAVAYILWLAYKVAIAPPLAAKATGSPSLSLAGGTVLGVANPKAWVAIAAVFASTRLADTATKDAVAKVAVLSVMIALITAGWLLAGMSLAPVLRNPRRARVVNAGLAAALVGATGLAVLR